MNFGFLCNQNQRMNIGEHNASKAYQSERQNQDFLNLLSTKSSNNDKHMRAQALVCGLLLLSSVINRGGILPKNRHAKGTRTASNAVGNNSAASINTEVSNKISSGIKIHNYLTLLPVAVAYPITENMTSLSADLTHEEDDAGITIEKFYQVGVTNGGDLHLQNRIEW